MHELLHFCCHHAGYVWVSKGEAFATLNRLLISCLEMSHLHQIRLRHTYWLILKMIEAYAMNSLAKLCQGFRKTRP